MRDIGLVAGASTFDQKVVGLNNYVCLIPIKENIVRLRDSIVRSGNVLAICHVSNASYY